MMIEILVVYFCIYIYTAHLLYYVTRDACASANIKLHNSLKVLSLPLDKKHFLKGLIDIHTQTYQKEYAKHTLVKTLWLCISIFFLLVLDEKTFCEEYHKDIEDSVMKSFENITPLANTQDISEILSIVVKNAKD